ncbi:unnamed protein product, partial [Heterotrigona itama]
TDPIDNVDASIINAGSRIYSYQCAVTYTCNLAIVWIKDVSQRSLADNAFTIIEKPSKRTVLLPFSKIRDSFSTNVLRRIPAHSDNILYDKYTAHFVRREIGKFLSREKWKFTREQRLEKSFSCFLSKF